MDFCTSKLSTPHPVSGKTVSDTRFHKLSEASKSSDTITSKALGCWPHSNSAAGTKYTGTGWADPVCTLHSAATPAKSPPNNNGGLVVVAGADVSGVVVVVVVDIVVALVLLPPSPPPPVLAHKRVDDCTARRVKADRANRVLLLVVAVVVMDDHAQHVVTG